MTIIMPLNAEQALSQVNQISYMLNKAKRSVTIAESNFADIANDPAINFPECYGDELLLVEEKISTALCCLEQIHEALVKHLLSKVTWETPVEEAPDDD